jgi:hypothetical protein
MPDDKVILDALRFDFERETKNTFRYEERERKSLPKAVGTIYIQKYACGNPPPKSIEVTITGKE